MRLQRFAVPGACGLFAALGALLIPLAGLQADEALFGTPLYPSISNYLWTRPWRIDVPPMVMTYVGSLKSFLYLPIFQILGANLWTIRFPMVLAGAATIFLFYRLAEAAVGRRAALLGTFLLASDPLFLMTNTFDWGPVALEHLLLVTGCLALYRFGAVGHGVGPFWHGRTRNLALGFFCFGLALWNKAIFLCALAGLSAASLTALWPWVRRELRLRNLAVAAGAFLAGAAPFVYYNIQHPLITFSENTHPEPEAIPSKWLQVESGLQGRSLFGYIASEEWMEPAQEPAGLIGRASAAIRDRVGPYRSSGFYYAAGALLLLVPLWWRSRAAWFSLVFCTVSWLWMASMRNAGTGAHHIVLLWPFPILFVAAALRRAPGWLLLAGGAAMMLSNLLVVNQYLVQLHRNGAYTPFTDAMEELSSTLDPRAGKTVYITDWGLYDSLNLLHRGELKLHNIASVLLDDQVDAYEADLLRSLEADSDALVVGHVAEREVYPGSAGRLDGHLVQAGLRREVFRVVADTNGRPMFELARIVPR